MAKYRVKTDLLQDFSKGDVLNLPNGADWDDIIDRNPEWFEREYEFKEGDWVWVTDGRKSALVKYSDNKRTVGFGFDAGRGNNWSEKFNIQNVKDWDYKLKEATPREIQTHLIKEAERRGFKNGIDIKPVGSGLIQPLRAGVFSQYHDNLDCMLFDGHIIYKEGKWAEIVEEEHVKINGHEVKEVGDNYIRIGCETIGRGVFTKLSHYSLIYGLSIHRRGEDITRLIHEIAGRVK